MKMRTAPDSPESPLDLLEHLQVVRPLEIGEVGEDGDGEHEHEVGQDAIQLLGHPVHSCTFQRKKKFKTGTSK